MAVSPLLHQSHEVLNADFCSGYIDAFGKWNTGFPCPWTGVQGDSSSSSSSGSIGSTPGFCCGTETYKYCCSGKLRGPLIPAISGAQPPPAISDGAAVVEDPLLLVLAVTLGVAAGMTLLILIACFVCPGCLLHKKRRPGIASGGGPLYRLPCSSTMSTYVPSCGGASTTTTAAAAATTTGGVAAITTPSGGGGGGVGHMSRTYHQHHPASMMSFLHHDVNPRPSASFHSFNGAAALGVGVGGGMASASLYSSLSESAAAVIGDNNNVHQQQQYSDAYGLRQRESGDDGNDDEEGTANLRHLHRNLFWGGRQQQQQEGSSSSNQGHGNHNILRHCQEHRQEEEEEEADPSPPPPYQPNETDDDYRRHHQRIHHHLLHSSNSNRRMTQQQQQQLSNGNGNISPRQPAICIIDDAMLMHRDVDRHHHHHLHRHHHQSQLTFHSTKF